MSNLVNRANSADPKAFLHSIEHPQRQADGFALFEMYNRVTGLPPVMWGPSIVGYGEYTYTLASGKQDTFFRCGFSPRKQNLSLYLGAGMSERPDLIDALGKVKTSKACLYINKLSDVDTAILEQLIAADLEVMNQRYPQ